MMAKLLFFLAFFLTTLCFAGDMDLFLLIGQSNMAGRAEITPADSAVLQNVFLLNDKEAWEPARNPLNIYSSIRKEASMQKLGPGYSFAEKISHEMPGKNIGLVVNARGGTAISLWKKGTLYYTEAIRRATLAMQSGTLRAILWHQGESDQNNASTYLATLRTLIEDLRADLGNDSLLFIAGQIGTWRESAGPINAVIAQLPDSIPFTAYADAEGLTDIGDNAHFDSRSQRILCERYADALLQVRTHVGQNTEKLMPPDNFILLGAFPNPFNQQTRIAYTLLTPANIKLSIYNILGKKVMDIESGYKTSGQHQHDWLGKNDLGEDVSSGQYIYILKTGAEQATGKLTIIR